MVPIVGALLGTLAQSGLTLLSSAIQAKGKEVVEKTLGVQIPDNPSPQDVEKLRQLQYDHEERLLELGIAQRPGDIDITYLTGYGFPAHQGGPMFMADRIGLPQVLADIERLHAQYGHWWQPAPLLVKLVREGKRFADLQTSGS